MMETKNNKSMLRWGLETVIAATTGVIAGLVCYNLTYDYIQNNNLQSSLSELPVANSVGGAFFATYFTRGLFDIGGKKQ